MKQYCLKRNRSKVLPVIAAVLLVSFSFLVFPRESFAATDMYLSPNGGTFGQSFTVTPVVNTNGKNVAAVEYTLNFSGPIKYSAGGSGNFCSAYIDQPSASEIHVLCVVLYGEKSGSGTVGSFTFVPTASGTATMTLTGVEIGEDTVGSVSGGTYTISPGATNLPETGIIQDVAIIGAGVALVVAAGYVVVSQRRRFEGLRNVVIVKSRG